MQCACVVAAHRRLSHPATTMLSCFTALPLPFTACAIARRSIYLAYHHVSAMQLPHRDFNRTVKTRVIIQSPTENVGTNVISVKALIREMSNQQGRDSSLEATVSSNRRFQNALMHRITLYHKNQSPSRRHRTVSSQAKLGARI